MKITRSAGVYLHSDRLIIYAHYLAAAGYCIATTPVFRLSTAASPMEVGVALRKALASFQEDMPDPLEWKTHRAMFLKATGFKSWKALQGLPTRSCWIEEVAEKVIFTPLKNGGNRGPKKGFQPFGRNPLDISISVSDEELGNSLLQVLIECE